MEAKNSGNEFDQEVILPLLEEKLDREFKKLDREFKIDEDRLATIHDYAKKFSESEHRVLASGILEYTVESLIPIADEEVSLANGTEEKSQMQKWMVKKVQEAVVSVDKLKTELSNVDIQEFINKTYKQINESATNESPAVLLNLISIWNAYKNSYSDDAIIEKSEKLSFLALWQLIHRAYPYVNLQSLD